MTEQASPARPVVGVQVVVARGSLVLLGCRRNVFGHGSWGLPGGHLEFGESFEGAAARELLEETGLKASELRTFMPFNTPYESTHYVQIGVEALRAHGEPRNLEPHRCSELAFFPLDHLPAPLFEPSVPFIDHVKSRLRQHEVVPELALHLVSIDPDKNRSRFVSCFLFGSCPCRLVVQYGRLGERRPREQRVNGFEALTPAMELLRKELRTRVAHGYRLVDCFGNLSVNDVRGLFPGEHPLRLMSAEPGDAVQVGLPLEKSSQLRLPMLDEFPE